MRRDDEAMRELGRGVLLGIVLAALLLVALRVNSIDLRIRKGNATKTEQALVERKQRLTVERSRHRDPLALQSEATELGFGPPERVIELPPRPARPGRP